MYQHTGFLSNIKIYCTCTPSFTSKDMAPTRDEHEREIATAEAAAIGYSKRFRFRSVKVRGASGRANPGSKLSLRGLKPVPCHVKPSIGSVLESVQPLRRTCDILVLVQECLLGFRRCRLAPYSSQRKGFFCWTLLGRDRLYSETSQPE